MTKSILFLYTVLFIRIPTLFHCRQLGVKFNPTWRIIGRPIVIKRRWYERVFLKHNGGTIRIGDGFCCNNSIRSNSIGIIQPCVFDIAVDDSQIIIGNNVGISGSTINASKRITIEDNFLIGSGCIISDTDSHPINYDDRIVNDTTKIRSAPIHIKEGAFIGARSIILKGVTIGRHAVIGAGSVVTKSVPDFVVVCGNPAQIVRNNNLDSQSGINNPIELER